MNRVIRYNYVHQQTEATTGYFACRPDPSPDPAEIVSLLLERPLESFLRRHAVGLFSAFTKELLTEVFQTVETPDNDVCGVISSFLAELALVNPALKDTVAVLRQRFKAEVFPESSPLLYLRRELLPDAPLHAAWAEVFHANIHGHRKPPSPEELAARGLPPLFSQDILDACAAEPEYTLADIAPGPAVEGDLPLPSAEVAELALERLRSAGAVAGPEQRHLASLSPVGLLLPWRLDISVSDGRNQHSLQGGANTYGRGLSLAQARASCRMEMVERFSSYLSIANGEVKNRAAPAPLLRGRRSALLERGEAVLDPNDFYLEAPYLDQELVWIQGVRATGGGRHSPVWAPLQMAALFSNCDEIDLLSAAGSTGIATGSLAEQARLAALVEILERDSEATVLYAKHRCFQIDPDSVKDEILAALLRHYRSLGINLQFMDLTGSLGLPCYQAFVIGAKGNIHRGHGASLSGPRALVAAITETPYPYPDGGASGPMLRKLPVCALDDLPDYSTCSVQGDLGRLEDLLCAAGKNPVYVDLSHALLKFPVVRALVPGMRPTADFDAFSRLSPRLYKDYLSLGT